MAEPEEGFSCGLRLALAQAAGSALSQATLRDMAAVVALFGVSVESQTALRFPEALSRQVPAALAELDAAMRHISVAADVILDACEALEASSTRLGSGGACSTSVTRIYEACEFGDVVVQRLVKVARVLQAVSVASAEAELALAGQVSPAGSEQVGLPPGRPPLEAVHGRAAGLDQDAVDTLMAGVR